MLPNFVINSPAINLLIDGVEQLGRSRRLVALLTGPFFILISAASFPGEK